MESQGCDDVKIVHVTYGRDLESVKTQLKDRQFIILDGHGENRGNEFVAVAGSEIVLSETDLKDIIPNNACFIGNSCHGGALGDLGCKIQATLCGDYKIDFGRAMEQFKIVFPYVLKETFPVGEECRNMTPAENDKFKKACENKAGEYSVRSSTPVRYELNCDIIIDRDFKGEGDEYSSSMEISSAEPTVDELSKCQAKALSEITKVQNQDFLIVKRYLSVKTIEAQIAACCSSAPVSGLPYPGDSRNERNKPGVSIFKGFELN
jgi:hypothetical protein